MIERKVSIKSIIILLILEINELLKIKLIT